MAALLLLGLGLRLAVASMVVVISRDGTTLVRLGLEVAQGHWEGALAHPQHPLTAVLLGLTLRVIPDPLLAPQVLMVLASTLALLPLWLLGRDLGGPRVGLVVLLLAAAHGVSLRLCAIIVTEPVYLLCLATCAAAGWRAWRQGGVRAHLLFGLAGALGYLTRPEGLLLPAALGLLLAWRLVVRRHRWRRRLLGCVLGGVLAILVAGPYVAYLSAYHPRAARPWDGGVVLTRKKDAPPQAEYEMLQAARERLAASAPDPGPVATTPAEPGRVEQLDRLQQALVEGASIPVATLLLLTPLVWCWSPRARWQGWRAHLYLVMVALPYLLVFAWQVHRNGYLAGRQTVTLASLLLPWAGMGALGLAHLLGGREGGWRWCLILGLILSGAVAFNLHKGMRRHGKEKHQVLAAAELVRAQDDLAARTGPPGAPTPDSPLILGNLPRVAFYAGLRARVAPDREPWMRAGEWAALLEESLCRVDLPEFLVLDEEEYVRDYQDVMEPRHPRLTCQLELLARLPARRPANAVVLFRVRCPE